MLYYACLTYELYKSQFLLSKAGSHLKRLFIKNTKTLPQAMNTSSTLMFSQLLKILYLLKSDFSEMSSCNSM